MEVSKTELIHAIPAIPDAGGFVLKIKTNKPSGITFRIEILI
jgi:hypothetical protein